MACCTLAGVLVLATESGHAQPQGAGLNNRPALSSLSPRKAHKIRVTDKAVAEQIEKDGGEHVADYGSFQLFEVDADAARKFDQRGARNENALNRIALNVGNIDTSTEERRSQRTLAGAFGGKRLRLVQFAGPVRPDWWQSLEQTGVRIVSYIPNNTYLVYGDAGAVGRMQGWARAARHVQWDGTFDDDFKIHPRARRNGKTDELTFDTDLFAIQLVDDPEANAVTLELIDRLKLAPIRRQSQDMDFLNIIVHLPPERLEEIAARPEVISIQPYVEPTKNDERQNQIIAGNLTGGLPNGPGYFSWLQSKGFAQEQFTSSGFVVDISDSGVDRGNITNVGHFGLYREGQTNLGSRLVYARLEGTANTGSTIQGCDGHGTINAHIIAGFNNLPAGFPHTDSEGYHYGQGVCPFVKIGSSVIFDPSTYTFPNFNNLQSRAYNNGARISANSWGAPVSGAYNTDSQSYDRLVRDAQPAGSAFATAGNQQMVIVFAAGNNGSSAQTVGSPGTGKNVITVGASENVHSHSTANGGNSASGSDGCGLTDSGANNANDMATFSSRGPCSDGRKKPDIVAPGTHVTGGVAQNFPAPLPSGLGSAISCFDGTGVCRLPGGGTTGNANNFFPMGQQFYTTSSGTSHSTPAVAGAAALLRQYFINEGITPPSPALTKAYLMNSARYMNGSGANDSLWSNNQGMGELNLGFALDSVPRMIGDQRTEDKFTATGQTRQFTGVIADSDQPFRVTLAWTDAPGSTAGNAFNNNLDLTVTVNGTTYLGNVFNGPNSTAGGSADAQNNVESVFLPAGVSGNFVVTVTAANVNSDGVPNEAPSLDQDFALVIYNAVETTVPVIGISGATVVAENCVTTNAAVDPYETVTMDFALNNTGAADTTDLVVTLLATNGITPLSGPQDYEALIAGGASVTQPFTFTAAADCGDSITMLFQLQDGDMDLGTVSYSLRIGGLSLLTHSRTNSTSISIPATGTSGAASPFPSAISVSGITGTVAKVTVTLRSLSHTFPDDMDILLVGPGGQKVMLMSDSGGNPDLSGVTLTFDDSAASSLPDSTQISSGTYKPTDYVSGDTFSSPAPTGPYGTSLSALNGVNPNGTWSLFVQDDASQDSGSMAQGWSLSITTSNVVCCEIPLADVELMQSTSTNAVNVGGNVTFTTTLTNHGPDTAVGVVVIQTLPEGLEFVSVTATQGDCVHDNGTVTCTVGALSVGTNIVIVVETSGATSGNWTNTTIVTAQSVDVSPANNAASATTIVNSPPAISEIADTETPVNTVTTPIPFTVSDADTDATNLLLWAASSNTNLVPDENIVFGGEGSERTVTLTPAFNQFGDSLITVFVSDGFAEVSESFTLSVLLLETNTAPELTAIPDFTVFEGETLSFTNSATDLEVPPQELEFSLGDGAPQGAQLDTDTGVFTWTPTEEQGPATNSFTVIVTDNAILSLSATQTFTVIVLETNAAPTLSPTPDMLVLEGELLTVTNVVTDADIPTNALSFSLSDGAPSGVVIDELSGLLQWTPDETQGSTTNLLTVIVTDDGIPSLSATQTFTVIVLESNSPPSLVAITDFVLVEGETLTFTNSASDTDIPENALTFTLLSELPTTATLDATNGVFVWETTEADGPMTNLFTVIVTDDGVFSLTATQSFTVIVLETNSAPELFAIEDQFVVEGETLTVTNFATDADIPANALFFSLGDNPPMGVEVNSTNGVLTWTPTDDFGGSTNAVTVIVTDDGTPSLSATQTFLVVVMDTNQLPSLAAIADFVVVEGETLTFTNSASDPDIPTNVLTFTLLSESPTAATLDSTNGVFVWETTEADGPMTNLFTIIVSDDGEPSLSATQSFTIIVLETNSAPELSAIEDQFIVEGETLVVTNVAVDADLPANALVFTLTTNGHPEIEFNSETGVFKWTPGEEDGPATNVFTVIVTDDGTPSLSATQTLTVIVLEENSAPTLEPIQNQTVVEGQLLTVANSAWDTDIPANTLTFSLDAGSPTGVVIDEVSGLIEWTPDETQGPTTNLLTVIVTDDGVPSLSATQTFTVIVLETNDTPSLAAVSDFVLVEGETLTFTNSASDPDIPENVLAFTLLSESLTTASLDATNGVFALETAEADGPMTNLFTIIVSDDGEPSLSATQTFTVIVLESNSPPSLVAIPDFVLVEGETLTFTNSASDLDVPENVLTFALLSESLTMATLEATNGVFIWETAEADGPMTNLFTIVVTDGGEPSLSATQSFTVIVLETNSAPELSGIEDQIIVEGDTLVITNVALDADLPANVLTFTLVSSPYPEIDFNSETGVFKWTPSEADGPSTNQFTVIVTDDGAPSLSATQAFTVVVLEDNSAPVLAPIEDQTVYEGQLLTVTNSALDPDIPANMLTFSLGEGVPAGVAIDESSGLIEWTPDESQGSTTNVLTVIVTDDGAPSLSATQMLTVVVLESNSPPVLEPIPDHTIYAGSTLTFTNFATDDDLPANQLTFTFDPGTATTASVDATSGLFSWTTTLADASTAHAITVRVTDDGLPPMFDEKTFHVTVLAGPVIESITVSNGAVIVTWSAIEGTTYQLQSITNLLDTNWTSIPPDITADGETATHTNSLSTDLKRYYRVRLVE